MLDYALKYLEMGLSVVPAHTLVDGNKCSCGSSKCTSPGKHPRIKWQGRTKTALSDTELEKWWDRFPDNNVGIVTGNISGIFVVDVDGEEGMESLLEIGIDPDEIYTPMVRTGGGGLHMYFRYDGGSEGIGTRVGVLNKVDIRAEGGFVVAPPSIHASGRGYTWIEGKELGDIPLAYLDNDSWLKEPVSRPKVQVISETWYSKLLQGVGEGERNGAAARLAGRYFNMGMPQDEVVSILSAWNTLNDPPLPRKEIETVVHSIRNKDMSVSTVDTEDIKDRVSRLLKLDLISVKRITGDSPQFVLAFSEGICEVTTGQLLAPPQLQKSLAESTGKVTRKLSAKTVPSHDEFVQMLMDVAEDVDAGDEATGQGEMAVLLGEYLGGIILPMIPDGDPVPIRGSFRQGEFIWFSLGDLIYRGNSKWGVKLTMKQVAQRLRGMGAEVKEFRAERGKRRVWGIDPSWISMYQSIEEADDELD